MADTPTYPLILCDEYGLDLLDNDAILAQTNVLGFLKRKTQGIMAYTDSGNTWHMHELKTTYPINALTKFLAYTIYNPFIKVTFRWEKGDSYSIDDLKEKIAKEVDKDDDSLTQYEDAEVISQQIYKCDSFSEVVFVLNKFIYKVNVDELIREQESR